jgi:hypothetical protein
MTWTSRLLVAGFVSIILPGMLRADEPAKPKRWEDVAKAHKLTDRDIELLKQNRFVITGQPFKQVFTPYLYSDVPMFVTTDSLLNGFHVLFEESIYRLEQAQARKLSGILSELSKKLGPASKEFKDDPTLIEAARKRAAIFLGTARLLLDDRALPEDADLRATVQEEVQRVVAAKGISKPAWLGRPDPGFLAIDYGRFQPRGFYTKSPVMQRYFRAVSWLQTIPFRVTNDEELAALFLLGRAYRNDDGKEPPEGAAFWKAFQAFLGTADDWDLSSVYDPPREITKERLKEVRKGFRDRAGRAPLVNDLLRFDPAGPGGKPEIAFRFLSAYRLPDQALFQRTIKPELAQRDYPTGLEVCAILGSPFARARLGKDQPKVLEAIDKLEPLFRDSSLYTKYLRCLGMLLERTEPDAPAFLRSEAWKSKTCQTALAGWSQMRHTWILQGKQGAHFLSESRRDPGYLEPVPEFYGSFARLVKETQTVLRDAGAFRMADAKELAEDVGKAIKLMDRISEGKARLSSLSDDEKSLLAQFVPPFDVFAGAPAASKEQLTEFQQMLAYYQLMGKDLPYEGFDLDIADRWERLSAICLRLELLAHKQLRQVAFNEDENTFLRDYGKKLAGIMFYGGNSYFHPRDDAPRIADVFSNPVAGKHLLVGIGRARHLWVLYPTKGGDVLCRGAVLPYYEFAHPQRLTDAGWKSLLDSPQRPQMPEWIQPVTVQDEPPKPKKEK